jgi:hypothetical protein
MSLKKPRPVKPKRHTKTAETLNHYWQKAFTKTTAKDLTS